ncbi:16S rRNA (uracil(1498)-N(3))-methyltransferase [Stakelama saccharophila]|uniref:Ribosomal RNA small subunit methyltransferase E n=1 Tax=Stakelama saccharophila TaxID=3075605 RepID=A0ABZ0B971_9SPHN|nr:16S rRNA (uracil(1498)-N(3))-methyltransferase [Stakelama sp. W311]WNO53962.1 16S rRNA (uracil(1498)-N(3))-methyltransferase [Stakelama sp. W311]
MVATPAWPPQSTPRLFVADPLARGHVLKIDAAQAHYLISVMRTAEGDPVKLCDDVTGEWLATAREVRKRDLTLEVTEHLRDRETVPDFWLCLSPIKKGRIDWMVEKACELGAARIVPVLTRRTVVDKVKVDRLRAHMVEAAEQCGRTALPHLCQPVKLAALLADWPTERTLFFADEGGGVPAARAMAAHPGPAALLIGPEGGFDDAEREAIRALEQAVGIGLGPRILRADTAAAAAMAVWMATAGDW